MELEMVIFLFIMCIVLDQNQKSLNVDTVIPLLI